MLYTFVLNSEEKVEILFKDVLLCIFVMNVL